MSLMVAEVNGANTPGPRTTPVRGVRGVKHREPTDIRTGAVVGSPDRP